MLQNDGLASELLVSANAKVARNASLPLEIVGTRPKWQHVKKIENISAVDSHNAAGGS